MSAFDHTNRQMRLLGVLIAVLAATGLYLYVYLPQQRRHEQLRADLDRANSELSISLAKMRKAPEAEAQLEAAIAGLKALMRLIPEEDKLNWIVRDIESVALANRVTIAEAALGDGKLRGRYLEVPLTLALTGKYEDVLSFLEGLIGLPRIINVHGFTFEGGASRPDVQAAEAMAETAEAESGLPRENLISATVQATTYALAKGGGQVDKPQAKPVTGR
jgi:type IV pilus assembly protein PilO